MFVTHPTAAGTIVLDCWCRGNSEPATPVTDSRAGRADGAARVCAGHRASAAAGGIRGHPLPASGLNTRFSDRLERTAETSCEWVWRERPTLSRHASLDGPPLSRLWACASLARHQTPAPLAGTRAAPFERLRAERLPKTSARSVRSRYLSFSYVFIRCIRRIVQPKIWILSSFTQSSPPLSPHQDGHHRAEEALKSSCPCDSSSLSHALCEKHTNVSYYLINSLDAWWSYSTFVSYKFNLYIF